MAARPVSELSSGRIECVFRRRFRGAAPGGVALLGAGEGDIISGWRGQQRLSSTPMAFPLFPKSPGKDKSADGRAKPELTARHDARTGSSRRPTSAHEIANAAKAGPAAAVKAKPGTAGANSRERDITLTGPVTGPPSLIEW